MSRTRHKCFISYYHADQEEVDNFIEQFDEKGDIFIARALGVGMEQDIIDSEDTDYIMRRIRDLYLKDSTVTIIMIGKCTWARKYVDWEIQSSLRHGEKTTPNGLLGIVLPSVGKKNLRFPERLSANVIRDDDEKDIGYARAKWYPSRKDSLTTWIEDAFNARSTRDHLIENPRERYSYNRTCP